MNSIRELLQYRQLISYLVVLDLRVRYRGSFLGFFWTLANPLLLTLVLWAVFSRFGRVEEENYAMFLLSGLMLWIFFQQSVEQGLKSVVKHRSLIQKIYLPKVVFPITTVSSNLVNLGFFTLAYFIVAAVSGGNLGLTLVALPLVFLMAFVLATGTALLGAAANVFFRDIEHLSTVALRALFYLTPILYRPEMLGDASRFLKLNPLYFPIIVCRSILYDVVWPPLGHWLAGFGVAFALLFAGWWLFGRLESKFVYYA